MPVGLFSSATNGSTQIDDTHFCLSLKSKGTATATITHPTSEPATKTLRYVDVVYTSPDAPVFAIQLPETTPIMCAGVIAISRSGNVWTFRVGVMGQSGQNFSFNYFIYDRPDWITSGGSGIALRDASLKPIFNSNQPVMVVRGQQSGSYGSGRSYAFACIGVINYFHEVFDNTPEGFISTETMRFDGAYCTPTGVQRVSSTLWGALWNGETSPRFSPGAGLNGWGGGDVNGFIDYGDTVFSVIDVTNQ